MKIGTTTGAYLVTVKCTAKTLYSALVEVYEHGVLVNCRALQNLPMELAQAISVKALQLMMANVNSKQHFKD